MDFLSFLSMKEGEAPTPNIAVLNSVIHASKAIPFLARHRTLRLYLDNDEAGRRAAAEIVRLCPGPEIADSSALYSDFKDLNE